MTDDSLQAILESDVTPTEDGDPVFEAAWQARIFGLSVSMRGEDGVFEWESFQRRLAEEIADDGSVVTDGPVTSDDESVTSDERPVTSDEETVTTDDIEEGYYRHWLVALERLLVENGHVDRTQLQKRTVEFANGERTAAEFVEGDHEQEHTHDHGHEPDHGHDHTPH